MKPMFWWLKCLEYYAKPYLIILIITVNPINEIKCEEHEVFHSLAA